MGPRICALLLVSRALFPGVAGAQSAPAAAFPSPAAVPASAPQAAPVSPSPAAAPPAAAPPAAAPPAPPAAYPGPYPLGYPAPPPGYTYGYYYPPPPLPPPPRYPDDAAVSSSPFFDAILLAADWQHRISESVNLGAQAGLYVAGRLRLTAKIAFPTEGSGDQQADYGSGTKEPSLFYAFSVGFAAVRTPSFVLSPGVMLARTDVADYGTMLGLSLPFDWVTKSGLRLGFEGGLGRAIGGQKAVDCASLAATDCSQRPKYEDRESGLALWLQFQIGFGFNHPGPLPETAVPPTAPTAPAAPAAPAAPPP